MSAVEDRWPPPYAAEIRRHRRWGPWAWVATYSQGRMEFSEIATYGRSGHRVAVKACRKMARWEARDALRREATRIVNP